MADTTLTFAIIGKDVNAERVLRKVANEAERTQDRLKKVDDSNFQKAVKGLDQLGGKISLIAAAAVSLGPALIPVAAGLVAVTGALAAPLAAATAGLAAFAVFAVPAFKSVTTAAQQLAKAQDAVDNALTKKSRQTALIRQKQLIADLSPAQLAAATSLNRLSDSFKRLSASVAPSLMTFYSAGLDLVNAALPVLAGLAKATAPALTILARSLTAALGNPEIKSFIAYVAANAGPALVTFAKILGNLALGFGRLLGAFAPMSSGVTNGLLVMTQRFAEWAKHFGSSGAFQAFMAYVQSTGPAVKNLIVDLATAMKNLSGSLAAAGPGFLLVVVELLKLVNSMYAAHPALTTLLIQMALWGTLALKVASALKVLAAISLVAKLAGWVTAAGNVSGALTTMRLKAMYASDAVGGMSRALGIATIAAVAWFGIDKAGSAAQSRFSKQASDVDKLNTSLLRLGTAGKFGGELGVAFGDESGLAKALKQVTDPSLVDRFKKLDLTLTNTNIISRQLNKFGPLNDFKVAGENVKNLDTALAGLVSGGNAATAATAFDRITTLAKAQGVSLDALKKQFPQYAAALDAASAAAAAAAPPVAVLTGKVGAFHDGLFRLPDGRIVKITTPGLPQSEEAIRSYHNQLEHLPDHASTSFSTPGIKAADAAVQQYHSWLEHIPDHVTTQIHIVTHHDFETTAPSSGSSSRAPGGRASGGPVYAGVPYIVGEHRPELFVPRENGTIIPRVPAMSGAGGIIGTLRVVHETPEGRVIQTELLKLKQTTGGHALGLA